MIKILEEILEDTNYIISSRIEKHFISGIKRLYNDEIIIYIDYNSFYNICSITLKYRNNTNSENKEYKFCKNLGSINLNHGSSINFIKNSIEDYERQYFTK